MEDVLVEGWVLETAEGGRFDLGSELVSWEQIGLGGFSGFMRYRSEFVWEKEGIKAVLWLGELRYAAAVFVDGRKVGDSVFTPFRLELGSLSRGKHLLEIDVQNTQANSVFGDRDRLESLRRDRVFEGTYAPLYEALDMSKLRSGLLGPVRLGYIA